MRHQRVMKKFGRSMEHRKAMMKNMVTNLILAESITTTLPKAKQARKSQKVQKVKEIKFHPGTDTNDFDYKLKQIRGFIGEGCKVKLTLQYRGRENAHRELGEDVINRVLEALKDECFVEQAPKTLGRVLGALIGPPRKNGPKPAAPREPGAPGTIRISVS